MQPYANKRILNNLENPVYPDIKKGPVRYINVGKHWKVDSAIMRESEMPFMYSDSLLAQGRDYQTRMNGVPTYNRTINEAFMIFNTVHDPYAKDRGLHTIVKKRQLYLDNQSVERFSTRPMVKNFLDEDFSHGSQLKSERNSGKVKVKAYPAEKTSPFKAHDYPDGL